MNEVSTEYTGTSAVNARGEVLVFCGIPPRNVDSFFASGNRLTFLSDGHPFFSETFGPLTMAVVAIRGEVLLCFAEGQRVERVGILHGL